MAKFYASNIRVYIDGAKYQNSDNIKDITVDTDGAIFSVDAMSSDRSGGVGAGNFTSHISFTELIPLDSTIDIFTLDQVNYQISQVSFSMFIKSSAYDPVYSGKIMTFLGIVWTGNSINATINSEMGKSMTFISRVRPVYSNGVSI